MRPAQPVVSYLTPLTGLTRAVVEQRGVPLERALAALRQALPATAVLVGQNIMQDVRWLGLVEGRDFASLVDLAGLFRVFNPKFNSFSLWSQDHLASVLLGWPAGEGVAHDAAGDAAKSMRLFALHAELKRRSIGAGNGATRTAWEEAEQALLESRPTSSFAKRHPVFEGVCMGGKKTCVWRRKKERETRKTRKKKTRRTKTKKKNLTLFFFFPFFFFSFYYFNNNSDRCTCGGPFFF